MFEKEQYNETLTKVFEFACDIEVEQFEKAVDKSITIDVLVTIEVYYSKTPPGRHK